MNKSLTVVVSIVSAALAVGASLAQEANAPAQPATAGQPASAMDMTAQKGGMGEHMNKMQALHDKMMSAITAGGRQTAMDEACKEMQEGMGVMQPMMHAGMMGEGMMDGGVMGQKGKSTDADAQMQMMDKRMDMTQMMMQMMMDQQGMMGTPKTPGTGTMK